MKFLLVLSVVVTVSLALPARSDDFETFKVQFGKLYENDVDEQYHKAIFLNTKAYIEAHNADTSHGYTLGINEFSDLDPVIFAKERNGYLGSRSLTEVNNSTARFFEATGQAVPASGEARDM